MSFKSWWRNENYDREHMRAFREQRHHWDDLPDDVVATSMEFQLFALAVAVRATGAVIKEVARDDWERVKTRLNG